ncbi:MAG: transcriptional regulator [Anaerolineales bacterium]|nr:transcriptional regulator [Anaerolineales bacterium]
MVNPNITKLRSKKIGVLLMDARLYRAKSVQECARVIGVTDELYESYEFGVASPSLPELESLAYYLKIPLDHFWKSEIVSARSSFNLRVDFEKLINMRHKVIGNMIQQWRTNNNITLESMAELTGISTQDMENYESGDEPLPLPQLELISQVLNRPVSDFQDQETELSKAPDVISLTQQLQEMPSDLRNFVMKPINRPYLELAQRLSEMSVDKLRAVAEGLLEITL